MAGVNKVIILGNLGVDPEVRTLESGVKVCRLSLATSESYTNKSGDRVEQTEWHSVTLWRGLAEVAEKYLRKGNKVYIEGKLRTRSYKDKDGIEKYITEIVADNMEMLGGGAGGDRASSSSNTNANQQSQPQEQQHSKTGSSNSNEDEEDVLPF